LQQLAGIDQRGFGIFVMRNIAPHQAADEHVFDLLGAPSLAKLLALAWEKLLGQLHYRVDIEHCAVSVKHERL
jgi:hypothetical protein